MRSALFRKTVNLSLTRSVHPAAVRLPNSSGNGARRSFSRRTLLLQQVQPSLAASNSARGYDGLNSDLVTSDASKIPTILPKIKAKRTNLQNPADHTIDHEGFFYTVPQAQIETTFGTLKTRNQGTLQEIDTLAERVKEHALMIRRPALEIMEYIKKSNMSYPAVR